jgi:hypothetical protein
VYVNPIRFNTGKNQYTLHKAHLSNFNFANKHNLIYDYFILEASNSLFIKEDNTERIKQYDVGIGKGKIAGYWKDNILTHKSLEEFVTKKIKAKTLGTMWIKGVHEGSFYKYKVISSIFKIIYELDRYCELKNDLPIYPTEEVWFQVGLEIYKLKHNINITRTLTYLPWDKQLVWTENDIDKILNNEEKLPEGTYAIKRIERKYNDLCRKKIGTFYNYRK